MQLALDASVAELVPPPGAAPTDTYIQTSDAPPTQRGHVTSLPAFQRPSRRRKYAPPDLRDHRAVTVVFVPNADLTVAQRFLDAVVQLREWGRESISQPSAALEAAAS